MRRAKIKQRLQQEMFEVAFERPSIFVFKTFGSSTMFCTLTEMIELLARSYERGDCWDCSSTFESTGSLLPWWRIFTQHSWGSLTIREVIEASLPSQWNFRNVSIVRYQQIAPTLKLGINYVKIAELFHGNSFMIQHNLKSLDCNSVDSIDCNVSIPEQHWALSSRIGTIRECAPGRMARHPIERVH